MLYKMLNKKAFTDRTVRTMGPILWNPLDETIKKSRTAKHFRSLYKSSLISTYYKTKATYFHSLFFKGMHTC